MQRVKIRFAYKRGFVRLWAVLSVCWIALAAMGAWNSYYGKPEETTLTFLALGLIPVVGLYLLGLVLFWIIEGFAQAD